MYIYHLISIDLQSSRLLNSPTLALLHIIYYLKTIIDAELNYHIYNKEMLAIISSF